MSVQPFEVTFLILGAQKAGTTALAHFLGEHPEICMAPGKEVHFFDDPSFDDATDRETLAARYRSAFPNFRGERLVGEATPIYMYLPHVAERIFRYKPEMKLIFLLRDPVARAISHYRMSSARKEEHLPLFLALMVEPWRLWRSRNDFSRTSSLRRHSYRDRGYYGRQARVFLNMFPREQILFLSAEKLWDDHRGAMERVYEFLGVADRGYFAPQERIFASDPSISVGRAGRWLLKAAYTRERNSIARMEGGT